MITLGWPCNGSQNSLKIPGSHHFLTPGMCNALETSLKFLKTQAFVYSSNCGANYQKLATENNLQQLEEKKQKPKGLYLAAPAKDP